MLSYHPLQAFLSIFKYLLTSMTLRADRVCIVTGEVQETSQPLPRVDTCFYRTETSICGEGNRMSNIYTSLCRNKLMAARYGQIKTYIHVCSFIDAEMIQEGIG